MAAITATSSAQTVLSGRKIYTALLSPGHATTDTLDLSSVFKAIDSVQMTWKEAPTANCAYINATVSSTTISFNLQTSSFGGAAALLDFYITVVGTL